MRIMVIMYLLALMFVLAGAFIYVAHSKKWLIIYLGYTAALYLLLASIEGFAYITPVNSPARMAFWVTNTIIVFLHIPIIIRLSQLDLKNFRVKKAREIFDKDVSHLHDDKLHKHLGH